MATIFLYQLIVSSGFLYGQTRVDITLQKPVEVSIVDPTGPITFEWNHLPTPALGYTLKIVEILQGQNAEVAMQANVSFFKLLTIN